MTIISLSRVLSNTYRRFMCMQSKHTYYSYSKEPYHPLKREPKWTTAEESMEVLKSGDVVFVHGTAATPLHLLEAMTSHGKQHKLKDITVCHIHTEGRAAYTEPECEGIFRCNSFFTGENLRAPISEGRADYVPIFLSEIPLLFHKKIVEIDVALVQIAPPDKHGFCSLGTNVDCARAALQHAKYIIGQVNPQMPRTFGDGNVHASHFDYMVRVDEPLPQQFPAEHSDVERKIGQTIAMNLVDNGATLQVGIGNIPDIVMTYLTNHRDLGVHSEVFSDGVVDLVERGCITNHCKVIHKGKIVGSFAVGTNRLYKFINNNPFVVMAESDFVNRTAVIEKNPMVTAINTCLEVDLTGQIVSDSIGTAIYSGVGGQIDFLRAAAVAHDGRGKPILALPSTTTSGESRIVPFIKEGSGVVTTRAHVHYIVTEFGIAFLFGKNLRQRAYALINVAHPTHREMLEKAAFERLRCMPSP